MNIEVNLKKFKTTIKKKKKNNISVDVKFF